jgi:hypothetical protein
MKPLRGTIVAVALAVLAALPAAAAPALLEPQDLGWQRFFSVTWNTAQYRGHPVVEGYIYNSLPYRVGNLRVLVDSLDATGRVIDQRLAWVPGTLEPEDRLSFAVPVASAPRYRVRVFSYD